MHYMHKQGNEFGMTWLHYFEFSLLFYFSSKGERDYRTIIYSQDPNIPDFLHFGLFQFISVQSVFYFTLLLNFTFELS